MLHDERHKESDGHQQKRHQYALKLAKRLRQIDIHPVPPIIRCAKGDKNQLAHALSFYYNGKQETMQPRNRNLTLVSRETFEDGQKASKTEKAFLRAHPAGAAACFGDRRAAGRHGKRPHRTGGIPYGASGRTGQPSGGAAHPVYQRPEDQQHAQGRSGGESDQAPLRLKAGYRADRRRHMRPFAVGRSRPPPSWRLSRFHASSSRDATCCSRCF